jgi:DNA repair exonuclease SbcCD ATPase subunit
MGYMESVFERAETMFSSVDSQISWLSSFERPERGANAYTKDAVKVRDELASISAFKEDIKSTNEYEDLDRIKRDIKSMPSFLTKYKQELLDSAELKQDKINKELFKIMEERKKERTIEEKQEKIDRRKQDIQNDLDNIRDLEDVSRIQKRINNLKDEADTSNLESQLEGIQRGIEEQILSDRRAQKEEELNSSDRRRRESAARWLREHQ